MMDAIRQGAVVAAIGTELEPSHPDVLRSIVREFKGLKIAVLGDPMLDYYHFGHVDRLSPEAPVPVFVEDKIDLRDGGAGNVVANLAALGCTPIPLFPPAPYTMKHRYLVGAQQLFRIDRDQDHSGQLFDVPPQGRVEGPWKAAIISDYAKGWCSTERCQNLIEQGRLNGTPVIVDPKGADWMKYVGATVICPNEKEMGGSWMGIPYLVHKRGPRGLDLLDTERHVMNFPARARQVFDVTGAGDTVVAVLAAALAVRCEIGVACELANIAAGVVVGQVGTSPCSAAALLAELA